MRLSFIFLFLLVTSLATRAQEVYQLAPPVLTYSSVFFRDKAALEMEFAKKGSVIHYTTNGDDPTERDAVYVKPLRITKSFTTVKARVFEKDFLPSEIASVTFIKSGLPIASIETSPPNEKYTGKGSVMLTDLKGGHTDYSDKSWLGFDRDTVCFTLQLEREQSIGSVLLHCLQHQGAWIFGPEKMDVFVPTASGKMLVASKTFNAEEPSNNISSLVLTLNFMKKVRSSSLIIHVYPLRSLPDWHSGKGKQGWLFIDELSIYK